MNRSSANDTAIEAPLVRSVAQDFMAGRPAWQGTSAELLSALDEAAGDKAPHSKDWPTSLRKLSGDLRRVAPNLRAAGIEVDFIRHGKPRPIRLSRMPAETQPIDEAGEVAL